jgi:hypothetical protein
MIFDDTIFSVFSKENAWLYIVYVRVRHEWEEG